MLRGLRESDAEDVAGLFRAAFGDERPIDAAEIVSWFKNEELKPDWLRVLELEGQVVGYGDIQIEDNELALDAAAPGHWETFFEWAEERARAEDLGRVRVFLPAEHETERLVGARGYRLWRSAYTMNVDLEDAEPEVPLAPEGIAFHPYREGDEESLRRALNDAFVEDPFHHEVTSAHFREFYLRKRAFDPSLWLLAWDAQELAGFVLAFPERPGEDDLGWIEVLGVRKPWRRRGLGEALLRTAIGVLHARGLRRVGLGVDTENETGALKLYERIGMQVVRQGNNWALDLKSASS